MLRSIAISITLTVCILSKSCNALIVPTPTSRASRTTSMYMSSLNEDEFSNASRRRFFSNASKVFGVGVLMSSMTPKNALALQSVTVAEFETILRSSAKSVKYVELSGPKSETAIVTLIDGTQFGLSDLYESPTDPRSPLKLIATCRSYNVPTKSKGLEDAVLSLSSQGSKKKVVYMNSRVRDAAEKEKAKKERMEQDEIERLAELERMGLSE